MPKKPPMGSMILVSSGAPWDPMQQLPAPPLRAAFWRTVAGPASSRCWDACRSPCHQRTLPALCLWSSAGGQNRALVSAPDVMFGTAYMLGMVMQMLAECSSSPLPELIIYFVEAHPHTSMPRISSICTVEWHSIARYRAWNDDDRRAFEEPFLPFQASALASQ